MNRNSSFKIEMAKFSYAVNRIFEERYVVLVYFFRLLSVYIGSSGKSLQHFVRGFYRFLPQVLTVWCHIHVHVWYHTVRTQNGLSLCDSFVSFDETRISSHRGPWINVLTILMLDFWRVDKNVLELKVDNTLEINWKRLV